MKSVFSNVPKFLMLLPVLMLFLSCSNDEEAYARVTVNGTLLVEDVSDFNGDIDASFTGNGGTAIR